MELQEIYDEIGRAFAAKDLDGLSKFIDQSWTGEMGSDTVSREQLLENISGQFARLRDIYWPRTLSYERVEGDQVTVRAIGVYRAFELKDGEQVEMKLANDDTWVNGPDGWRNVHSVSIE
ncbi:hypothetical protein BH11ARM1_BH11ARM1_08300 [soil metagenome]